jgi:hypothetical protein
MTENRRESGSCDGTRSASATLIALVSPRFNTKAGTGRPRQRRWEIIPVSNLTVRAESHVAIHIFVEVSKNDQRRVEFDHNPVTGQSAAGVPLENDLGEREEGTLILITNDKEVTIKEGDHFVSLPPGTVS